MNMKSKRFREIANLFDAQKVYKLDEAIDILKKCPPVKFDQSVDVALKTGIDLQKSDQQVRGVVSLPNGTGKKSVVIVFAKGDKVKEALDAGADFAGTEDLYEKVKDGWTNFDAVISTPDMMRDVGKLGKVLGPRGLMPTPKAGTVTNDIATAVREIKAGRIEFKNDKHGVISSAIGKLSFSKEKLEENIRAFITAVARAKPSSAKGHYIVSLALSSTMGPGLKIELSGMVEA
ncbi:MAG TPA: 50S ribosomal protein L1 [Rhabdochlamydiaceae bacterium]|nr:50S ribosomal protein L1 [Rhabdochlamydiaceae bacterium]